MTEDLVSDNWATFEFAFTVGMTLPTDFIGSTTVASQIISGTSGLVLFNGNTLSSQFPVAKPAGGTLTSSTLISFGVDPTDSTK